MRPLKNFEDYLKLGIIKKITPNIARAKSLIEEAKKRKKFIEEVFEKIRLKDENANYFIENSYDILMELIRSQLLANGFSSSGEGTHEAEISFMRNLEFSENETRFLNDLRYFRNGILYYGKNFDEEYGKRVIDFLNKLYPKLMEKNEKYFN